MADERARSGMSKVFLKSAPFIYPAFASSFPWKRGERPHIA
jgi:hypothetical protein